MKSDPLHRPHCTSEASYSPIQKDWHRNMGPAPTSELYRDAAYRKDDIAKVNLLSMYSLIRSVSCYILKRYVSRVISSLTRLVPCIAQTSWCS